MKFDKKKLNSKISGKKFKILKKKNKCQIVIFFYILQAFRDNV